MSELVLSVSDFVAVFNQTLEYAYPSIAIIGELANFRISKNRWVYFDLKDEHSSVKFFGTVYQLPGPLEDGLMIQVKGQPRLHSLYGFSVGIQSVQAIGEGSLKRALALLEAKLTTEGIFDESRKRSLPYPPKRIGLITSSESAAYRDFLKVLNERWSGIEIQLADIQVQGELAVSQTIFALEYFNSHANPVETIVITRGGGSAEDLATFSTEQVTRAVAASRIPTLVAIGHETDISLAELAADLRASTPSNAAQLLSPDRLQTGEWLKLQKESLTLALEQRLIDSKRQAAIVVNDLQAGWDQFWQELRRTFALQSQLLEALSPQSALKRGYAVVRLQNKTLRSIKQTKRGDSLTITLGDGNVRAKVQ